MCGCLFIVLAGHRVGFTTSLLGAFESLSFGTVSLFLFFQLCTVSGHSSLLCDMCLRVCLCRGVGSRLLCCALIAPFFPLSLPLRVEVSAECAHVLPATMFVFDHGVLHPSDHSYDAAFTGHACLLRRSSKDAAMREDAGEDSRECIGVSTLY